jgi:hypothetical protein
VWVFSFSAYNAALYTPAAKSGVTMKHSFMVITTTFELEPVLVDYFEKYPEGRYDSYKIVFQTQDDQDEGTFSYIIVFEYNTARPGARVDLSEYIKSYCTVNKQKATASQLNNILPRIGEHGHKFG